ncbi:MAG: NAD(P)H-binding protein [Anaerolineae bacterium]|nr:NAD(P)H-binding protein [Anaerolineae bacterium]
MSGIILVTGASRRVGGEVVRRLAARGARVRAAVEGVDTARDQDWAGVEVAAFDYGDPATYPAVFAGADRLLLVMPPGDFESQEGQIARLIAYARQVGVEHIVFISAMGTDKIYLSSQWMVEQYLMQSGVDCTVLRSGWFFQNFVTDDALREGIRRGVLRLPLGEAKVSGVDLRDVAEVAVVALTEKGHRNRVYSLGEHLLSAREQAALLSKVLGRPIVYEPISEHEAAQALRAAGVDRQVAKWWRIVYQLMRQGAYSSTAPDVSRVLGRPSIPFKQFAQGLRARLAGGRLVPLKGGGR